MEDPATSTPPDVPARIRDQIQWAAEKKERWARKSERKKSKEKEDQLSSVWWTCILLPGRKGKDSAVEQVRHCKVPPWWRKTGLRKCPPLRHWTRVLDFFIERHHLSDPTSSGHSALQTDSSDGDAAEAQKPPPFLHLPVQSAQTEDIFLSTPTAVSNLVQRVWIHSQTCGEPLFQTSSKRLRHALHATFSCKAKHSLQWTSSPHVERGGKLPVNVRLAHGLFSSGMLPVQYEKSCDAANMGVLGETYLSGLQSSYADVVHEAAEDSQKQALPKEISIHIWRKQWQEDRHRCSHGGSALLLKECNVHGCSLPWRQNAQSHPCRDNIKRKRTSITKAWTTWCATDIWIPWQRAVSSGPTCSWQCGSSV